VSHTAANLSWLPACSLLSPAEAPQYYRIRALVVYSLLLYSKLKQINCSLSIKAAEQQDGLWHLLARAPSMVDWTSIWQFQALTGSRALIKCIKFKLHSVVAFMPGRHQA
jgi:hypothetical protein